MYQIGNFQPFRNTQTIRFKPINLIYGRNSSGKSAIIRSIVLLRHALKNEGMDVESISMGGQDVYLGGCESYAHSGDLKNPIVFTLSDHSFPTQSFDAPEEERLFADRNSSSVSIQLHLKINPRWRDVLSGTYDFRLPKLGVEKIVIILGGVELLKYSLPLEGYECDLEFVNTEHPHLQGYLSRKGFDGSEIERLPDVIDKLASFELDDPVHTVEELFRGVGFPPEFELGEETLYGVNLNIRDRELLGVFAEYCQAVDKELFPRCLRNEALLQMDYVGPWRKLPQVRMIDRLREQTPEELRDVWQGLLQDDEILERVNAWLTDTERLSCPYRFEILEHAVSGASQGDTEQVITPYKERELILVDERTNTPVSLRSVGMGISQVIPVLVHLMARSKRLLCIEQPELHLHPALQAELGDVFIESGLKKGNCVIAETHSEHLLLRIMRRMRQTANGSSSQATLPVRPEDVGVFYVDIAEDCSFVRELELTESGKLVQDWPYGFFDDGLREVLM